MKKYLNLLPLTLITFALCFGSLYTFYDVKAYLIISYFIIFVGNIIFFVNSKFNKNDLLIQYLPSLIALVVQIPYFLMGMIFSADMENIKTIFVDLVVFVIFGFIWIIYFATLSTNFIKTIDENKKHQSQEKTN